MALLWDEIARGNTGGGRLNAVQNLEDRFGISPKGRRQLQWEIRQAEVVEMPNARHLAAGFAQSRPSRCPGEGRR